MQIVVLTKSDEEFKFFYKDLNFSGATKIDIQLFENTKGYNCNDLYCFKPLNIDAQPFTLINKNLTLDKEKFEAIKTDLKLEKEVIFSIHPGGEVNNLRNALEDINNDETNHFKVSIHGNNNGLYYDINTIEDLKGAINNFIKDEDSDSFISFDDLL